ncbi:acyltransferase domain-containing protein [Streptomyces anulatus]|uniref:type I polyketide synthase n=1 Tax=Streptomyces anulatus TaxID=1892 RepID=UPI001C5F1B18|nr:beta-ketoacyl synthase N-terminal-like domain-containing protein [Streptomyces anulatus]QYA95663.1 acyltransferase domain-containing protein [Streptomyces anulatus]
MSAETGVDGAESDIAVIAMEGRFPGAPSLRDFWELLREGRDSIRPVADGDFLAAGGAESLLGDPDHVRVECTLEEPELFDAEFFGIKPAEAELLDPQHRVFIECAYHVLEQAGWVPGRQEGTVGVYAGASASQYYLDHVYPSIARRPGSVDGFIGSVANAGSALATRVSYLLNLTGPSVAVQTACSTSLVAVHLACQDLLNYQCDLALAGGSTVNPAARLGYRFVPGGPFSPDGHCRPYSSDAAGMSPGDGVGVVLLKRLSDALADGDHVRAVIKGSAVNNDGARKIGFTAPSVQGQRDVIVAAQAMAGVTADAIGYVEGHGTATPVGDPIEVSALTKAFASTTDRTGFCVLGSVKSNLGHLDAAAGIAGLIKTVLALENELIPATLHYAGPNPLIDFDASPFVVSGTAREWPRSGTPRLAGVSSFGVGGTNAHLVLAEAPARTAPLPSGRPEAVLLSAAGPGALAGLGEELREEVSRNTAVDVADLAHTLQRGRRPLRARRALVVSSTGELAEALRHPASGAHGDTGGTPRDVAFLYPGAGSQYQRMGQRLYENHPVYRREMDRCARIVASAGDVDLLGALYPPGDAAPNRENIDVPDGRYAAILATEWSLTALLASWGVRPSVMIGHSLGEYTAACVAGVMDLEEALPLVMTRERLIRKAGGLTLSVLLDEADVVGHLLPGTSLAGVNAPGMCTVSGRADAILQLEKNLIEKGIDQHRLRTPGAVHSEALDPVLDELREAVGRVTLREPSVPVLSGLTGRRLTAEEACDLEYWVRHTREPVRFRACLEALPTDRPPVLLEAGPSGGLVKLAQYTLGDAAVTASAVRHAFAEEHDPRVLLNAVARMWTHGVEVDWDAVREDRPGRTVPLPGYPFQRRPFWVERVDPLMPPEPERIEDVSLSARVWSGSGLPRPPAGRSPDSRTPLGSGTPTDSRTSPDSGASPEASAHLDTVLVVLGRSALQDPPAGLLGADGGRCVTVRFADGFSSPGPGSYRLDPARPDDVRALVARLWPGGAAGAGVRVLDLGSAAGPADPLREATESGLFADALVSALGEGAEPPGTVVVSHGAFALTGEDSPPERRLVHGPAGRRPEGASRAPVTAVDLGEPLSGHIDDALWRLLLGELRSAGAASTVAFRGGRRWVASTVPVTEPSAGLGALPRGWVVPGALRAPMLPYASFLSGAFGGAVTISESSVTTDGARPGLLRSLGGGAVSDPSEALAWLGELWRHRAAEPFGAVVLIDPPDDRPSVERSLVSSFAEACVEAAAAEGLPWRLLRWRHRAPGSTPVDGSEEAVVRRGADALAAALGATGHPVLTVTVLGPGATDPAAPGPVPPETDGGSLPPQDNGRARPPLSTPYAKPRNDVERRVTGIWREALGLDDIGVDDNFFELGGESLLLMRVVAQLREQFAVNMSIRQLYINDRLTVSGIATVLEEKTP